MIFSEKELVDSINKKNIENFNNNGGINMYVYKVSEDKDLASKKDAVLEKLKEIDSKYTQQDYIPKEKQTLGLEEMEFIQPTEDEIEKKAMESLSEYKSSQLSSIDDKYSSKFTDLNEKAQKALEENEEDIVSIDSKYDSSIKKTQNSNIEKGLSRSSIFNNALKEIENDKNDKVDEVDSEYKATINKLESERSILEQQKESALSSFDISYAVKLQNKIKNINSEIAKEQDKVLKYNQSVAKQESTYQKEQEELALAEQKEIAKKNKSLQDLINKNGEIGVSKLKAQEKYDIVYNYLSDLPKDQALKELQNEPAYKNQLGSYYTLLNALMLNRK